MAVMRKISGEAAPVNLLAFNDPFAFEVEWSPLRGGGSNFVTHRLLDRGAGRLEFRAHAQMWAFGGVFAGAGLCFGSIGIAMGDLFFALFALPFVAIGTGTLWFAAIPRVFDPRVGAFWMGWKAPTDALPAAAGKSCRLADIHALQIIRERVRMKNSRFWSYELNLVLMDGRRLHVTDHGNLNLLRDDAGRISESLGCKLWDATLDGGKAQPVAGVIAAAAKRPAAPKGQALASVAGLALPRAGAVLPCLLGAACMFAGAAIVAIFVQLSYQQSTAFPGGALSASGTVVEPAELKTGRGPLVRFSVLDEEHTLSGGFLNQFRNDRAGDTVRVLYSLSDPGIARIDDYSRWLTLYLIPAIPGLMLFLIGLKTFAGAVARSRRFAQLAASAQRIEARVTGIATWKGSRSGAVRSYLQAQWRNPATGRIHLFLSQSLADDASEGAQAETVTVLVNPANPRWYWMETPQRAWQWPWSYLYENGMSSANPEQLWSAASTLKFKLALMFLGLAIMSVPGFFLIAPQVSARFAGLEWPSGEIGFLGLVGLCFFALGCGWMIYARRRVALMAWLQQSGTLVQARVLRVARDDGLMSGHGLWWRIHAEWTDPATGAAQIFNSERLSFHPGDYLKDTVPVRVDRADPRRYWMDTSALPKLAE